MEGSAVGEAAPLLGRVLDDLGSTLLELVAGGRQLERCVGGVVILDPEDDHLWPTCSLVLAVGVTSPDQLASVLRLAGAHSAAAVIARAPIELTDELNTAIEESNVALLALARGAAWAHVAAMLRTILNEATVTGDGLESMGGVPSGDLFALANAIEALIDAPVTIEDRNSRVLAFSSGQHDADAGRMATILGRRVPDEYVRAHSEQGVFAELFRTDQPVWVEPAPVEPGETMHPRVAVAVRAGDEMLGSIWAMVHGPLSPDRSRALYDSAKLVALHMLHYRAGSDVQRRIRADLLSTALEGGPAARDALSRLGLVKQPVVLLALSTGELGLGEQGSVRISAQVKAERQRINDAFGVHLGAIHARSVSALVGEVTYGILPVGAVREGMDRRARRIATDFLSRVAAHDEPVIAIGPVIDDPADLARGRIAVDRILRVLHSRRSNSAQVAELDDVRVEALLMEMHDILDARGDSIDGPIARLRDYDDEHGTSLQETVEAWLDSFGDIRVAAKSVHVHPNTFRYRLKRLGEVAAIDLTNSDNRFAVMLQLRLSRQH